MEKKDALILGILSQLSSKNNTKNRFTAPEETYEAVKVYFKESEESLKEYKFDICAMGERHKQKKLTWDHRLGLLIHDVGVCGERPHWTEVHDSVLLDVVTLMPTLLSNAHKYATKVGAMNLKASTEAVLSGVPLPLVPAASPVSRVLIPEEDTPVLPTEIDEEPDDIYEEEEEEETPEDDGEEDQSSQEILGNMDLEEMNEDVEEIVVELPPAVVVPVVEAKKPRKSRKK